MSLDLVDLTVKKQPISTGAMAKYKWNKHLAKKFTATTRFGDEYTMYEKRDDYIFLPRNVCPIGKKDLRVKGHTIDLKSKVVLRPKQVKIVSKSVKLLKRGVSHIIEAYTGFGKTVVTYEIMSQVAKPTLIIVPKEDLLDGWLEEAEKCLGIPRDRIGIIRQDRCEVQGKLIVIAMLHSIIIEGRYPPSIRKNFGLVIFDEVHRLGADEFIKACKMFPAMLRLGLSATVERADGKEIMFQAHIGPVLVRSKSKPMQYKVLRFYTDWKCPRRKELTKGGKAVIKKVKHSAARIAHILPSIINDEFTNKRMISFLVKSYNKGRYIIVFSDRKEHLDDLKNMAKKFIPPKEMSLYVGGMKKDDRDVAKGKRVLFATYHMMKEGTNIPWFDTIIFASPRSDVKQATGRILREYPDKPMPIVFDRIDKDSGVFLGYSRKRMDFYKSQGAIIKNLES